MEHITDDEEFANILTREIQSEDCNPIWYTKINAYLQYKLNPNYNVSAILTHSSLYWIYIQNN